MKNYVNYLWCDKWFLDGNEAWLIPCEYNAMFHCMLDRKIIELIDRFQIQKYVVFVEIITV